MQKAIRNLGLLLFILCVTALVVALYVVMPASAQYTPPPSNSRAITVVNSSITASSLGAQAVCALHTDTGCHNSTTDATAANCPAGTLTAACTFPTSITIPPNVLRGTVSLDLSIGHLSTATLPNTFVEMYLDSTRIFAGTSLVSVAGSGVTEHTCSFSVMANGTSAPLAAGCNTIGSLTPGGQPFSLNTILSNTTPAIAIDTTVSHVLKVSVSYSANTTGNMAWLNGMRLAY